MYRKKGRGWTKHIDFMLLDVLCMQIAFIVSYIWRFGPGNPYTDKDYRILAAAFLLIDFFVEIVSDAFKNVLKRGYLDELIATCKHVVLVEILTTFFLFATQMGEIYSRMSYYIMIPIYVLVIGSDEVFNCTQAGENVGYSPELFGKNARAKKIITYAASFGDTTYDKLQRYGVTDDLMKWVSRINNISVRDNNSKEIITSLCKKTPIINLDPVLVGNIEKLKWKKPDLEYEYIVLYGYEYRFSKEECDKILHFAKSENCKVIALGERQFKSDIFIKCRPDEVLGYFSEAKYIITDTFHGSIFSIINHKKFVSLIRKATPQSSGNRQKLGFLLEQLYLQERLINSIDELSEKMHKNIDYVNVDKIREEERNKTMKYLENCIGER